ncbi:unnamed protein product [Sphagnum jensenii]
MNAMVLWAAGAGGMIDSVTIPEWNWKGRLILRRFRNGTGHRNSRTLLYEVYSHFGRLLRLLMNVVVRARAGANGWFILRRNIRLEQRKQQSARAETAERDGRMRTRSVALLTTTCTASATAQARK